MQTEKNSLSKREKRLLIFLAAVSVIAIAVVYGITPLYNRLDEKTKEYHALELEKIRIEALIATEQAIRDNRDAGAARHGGLRAQFLSESLSNEIGRILTGLCEEHNLQPIDQKLSAAKDFTLKKGERATDTGDSAFLIVSAVMTVKGGYSDVKGLLEAVGERGYLRISRLALGGGGDIAAGPGRVTISFEVAMLKDVSTPSN
jgi:hypothetical protein